MGIKLIYKIIIGFFICINSYSQIEVDYLKIQNKQIAERIVKRFAKRGYYKEVKKVSSGYLIELNKNHIYLTYRYFLFRRWIVPKKYRNNIITLPLL